MPEEAYRAYRRSGPRNILLRSSETVPRLVRKGSRSKGSRSAGRVGGAGGEALPARHRYERLRLQWAIRHAFLREKTECDDVDTTEDG